jgi:hypothetical protein
MGQQRPYPPDRREEAFEQRLWNLQLSDQEARDEILRRAHYYVHLASRTEYGRPVGDEVIKFVETAIHRPEGMTAPVALKTMIVECDRALGRFDYPWSFDDEDLDDYKDFIELGDKETTREVEELKEVTQRVPVDSRHEWWWILEKVEDLLAVVDQPLPCPAPQEEEDVDMDGEDGHYPGTGNPAESEAEQQKGKHHSYNVAHCIQSDPDH